MCMFKAKAEDEIRKEVVEDLKGDNEFFEEDDFQDQIKRITERRLKDEQFKASVHESKEKKKKEIEELKNATAPKGTEKPKESPKGEDNYSLKDIRALNDVADEDVDDFLELSKKFGLSPSEAKTNKDVQAVLKNRIEERRTAEATNVGSGKRGTTKVSGEALRDEASRTGKLPESDKDMEALVKARYSPRP